MVKTERSSALRDAIFARLLKCAVFGSCLFALCAYAYYVLTIVSQEMRGLGFSASQRFLIWSGLYHFQRSWVLAQRQAG